MEAGNKGTIVGGFEIAPLRVSSKWPHAKEGEKRVGFHFINAYRVKEEGNAPLIYGDQLDGKDYTYTGEVEYGQTIYNFTNQRYGAQPSVETQAASRSCGHDMSAMKKGPLAGISTGLSGRINWYGSGKTISMEGENTAMSTMQFTGETCLTDYQKSSTHMSTLLASRYRYIGIGIGSLKDSYYTHTQKFSTTCK